MKHAASHLLFASTHEWIDPEQSTMSMGITAHAQDLLGDIVFVELPKIGTEVKIGQELGVLESVKAAADYYAPIAGTITAVNTKLQTAPELINQDPYGEGWICQITPVAAHQSSHLLSKTDYDKHINEA